MDTMSPKGGEWLRSGVLKFDEMTVKEKLCFNAHTMELVGFVGGAIDNNVIKQELDQLTRDNVEAEMIEESVGQAGGDKIANDRPDTAEHLLLFMFTT